MNMHNLMKTCLFLFSDGPFMLLIFAGVASLCLAFMELFVYALLRSKRATFCLPNGGPTTSRGGKACSIIKEELTHVISRNSSQRNSRVMEQNNGTSPRINRFGSPRQNGDILKTNGLKNGHNFYQTQALLRKDVHKDENNAQL